MCPSSKGEKRPADVINAAIIGKQRRHPDNSWEERVSPMTHESGARAGKWTADVRDGSMIGIGGSLAAPPLPHHRTYGSVYGGSRSYANALRSNDSTRVGWAFGLIRRQERFDVFPSRLPGFTLRRR